MAPKKSAVPPPPLTAPADTPFKQQRLPAWQPILTPAWVIGTFLCIGLPFLAIGSVLKGESDSVVEYASPYGQEAQNSDTVNCGDASCEVSFTLGWDMDAPVCVTAPPPLLPLLRLRQRPPPTAPTSATTTPTPA